MLSWRIIRAIFRARSPVHIGYRQIGLLKTTRYYIPGRALWGAIINNLTKTLFEAPSNHQYGVVREFVNEGIRMSYFYPAINKNKIQEKLSQFEIDNFYVLIPEYTSKGLKYGRYEKEVYEQIFVGSLISTAINFRTRTAEEGSLHELEFIKNKVEIDGKVMDVYWLGYLFINANFSKKIEEYEVNIQEDGDILFKRNNKEYRVKLKESLKCIYVGGERNYGFGRLELKDWKIEEGKDFKIFNRFDVDLTSQNPIIDVDLAISHVEFVDDILEYGEIEPIVGLEWSDKNKGCGRMISSPKICIAPGSKVKRRKMSINSYGLLKPFSPKV